MNQYLLWEIEETHTGRDESKYKHTNGNPVKPTAIIAGGGGFVFIVFLWEPGLTVCVGLNITVDCVDLIKLITVAAVKSSFQLPTKLNTQHALVDETAEWFHPPQKES